MNNELRSKVVSVEDAIGKEILDVEVQEGYGMAILYTDGMFSIVEPKKNDSVRSLVNTVVLEEDASVYGILGHFFK